MGSNRWAHLIFVGLGLALSLVCVRATEWIWSYVGSPKGSLIDAIGITVGAVITFLAWRNKNTFAKASDIAMELKKVTWPTRKETTAATIVVLVTVSIAAVFLFVFDLIWSWGTKLILTP